MALSNGQKNKIMQFMAVRAKAMGANMQEPADIQRVFLDVIEKIIDEFDPDDVVSAYQNIKSNTNAALIAELQAQQQANLTANSSIDAEISDIQAEG